MCTGGMEALGRLDAELFDGDSAMLSDHPHAAVPPSRRRALAVSCVQV
jgi:hypothetical protein